MYAKVCIDSNIAAPERIYEYKIPDDIKDVLKPAMRVSVPFGKSNKTSSAFVVEISDTCEFEDDKLKSIAGLIDTEPVTTQYLMQIARFIRDNYFCTYAEALKTVLPSAEKVVKNIYYHALPCEKDLSNDEKIIYNIIASKDKCTEQYVRTKAFQVQSPIAVILARLVELSLIKISYEFTWASKEQFDEFVSLASDNPIEDYLMIIGAKAEKQQQIIKYLFDKGGCVKKEVIAKELSCTNAVLDNLEQIGLIEIEAKSKVYDYFDSFYDDQPLHVESTPDQKQVIMHYNEKCNEGIRKFLLKGVTGSGKTHVFFEMIDAMLKQGKQCLLLVPEISLTPQMMKRVRQRFSNNVAIMHSRLSAAKRYAEFLKIKRGEANIVLGARSALFMPFENLGLIVIDEEHETSYKSSQSPRYNAIEVAEKISEITGCNLVLASATPSSETYYKAMCKDYELLTLDKRINNIPMPIITIADMRKELRSGNRTPVSRLLAENISKTLSNGEQALLFLNRRGFNTYVFCRNCGEIEKCPNCEVSLTYHKASESLVCHYCGYKKSVPSICPSCSSDKIRFMGTGTEKIQQAVKDLFPQAKILRLDSDIARRKGAYENVLGEFSKGNADILIGTQMIVKGLDFDNVTLVGIMLADASLNFPDINAAARTFQLTSQAAGRAGRRSKQGRVIMQTYTPENETLVYCSNNDYEGFYSYDISHRMRMDYPPFSEIIGVFVANEDQYAAVSDCEKIYNRLNTIVKQDNYGKIKLYAPTPAFIQKLKNKYIYHTLVRYETESGFKRDFRTVYDEIKRSVKSNVFVEINPITLL